MLFTKTERHIQKLIEISTPAIGRPEPTINLPGFEKHGPLAEQLVTMLRQKNGFYAFESALHVFSASHFDGEMTLSRWNSHGLWRYEYGKLAEGYLFFGKRHAERLCLIAS